MELAPLKEQLYATCQTVCQKVSASPTARTLSLHRPAYLFMMAWPMLWGFFASPAPAVVYLPFALLLIICLQSIHTLHSHMNEPEEPARLAEPYVQEGIPDIMLLIGLCILSFFLAAFIGGGALFTTILWGIMVAAYPYCERLTWWPQVCYGVVFGAWPVLIGGAAAGEITISAFFLMIGAFFWAAGLETLRAGTPLDAENRLHNVLEILGQNRFSFVTYCLVGSFVFLVLTGLTESLTGFYYITLMVAQGILTYIYHTHNLSDEKAFSCRIYQASALIGVIIAFGFLIG